MSAPVPAPGLVHAAVVCDEPDEIVMRCLPELRRVAAAGGEVEVHSDRRVGRAFREGLPETPMRFPSPVGDSAHDLVYRLALRGGPGAVVGTACADTAADEGSDSALFVEDAMTLLLADAPLTIICIYDPNNPVGLQVAHRVHPWLLTAEGRVVNPEYRPPAGSSPVPAALIGPPLLELLVRTATELTAARSVIADCARSEGLAPEHVGELILAAHEGLLVAGGAALDGEDSTDLPHGEHLVTLRRAAHGTVAECRGTPRDLDHRGEQSDRLRTLSRICDALAVHDGAAERLIRILVRHDRPQT